MIRKIARIIIPVFIFLLKVEVTIGNPGFQQFVDYRIEVTMIDTTHSLKVDQALTYYNNSPDTLDAIWFHLWANAFKTNQSDFAHQKVKEGKLEFHFADASQRGGYQNLIFSQSTRELTPEYVSPGMDIARVILWDPLLPGDSVKINIAFTLIMPDASFCRLGYAGYKWFVTQWYPKPAVYDVNGWHTMPYLSIGEFFSEFGNFDVVIHSPADYVIAAPGEVHQPADISVTKNQTKPYSFRKKNLATLNENEDIIQDSSLTDLISHRYILKNSHDFAWFASKDFKVDIDTILSVSGKSIPVETYFSTDDELWKDAAMYAGQAVDFMENKVGAYPWSRLVVVQGLESKGVNMEYPGITLIGDMNSALELEDVIVHEVIHNWFYGALANNERNEPWIDEGFTTYYEMRFFEEKYGNSISGNDFFSRFLPGFFSPAVQNPGSAAYQAYIMKAAANFDQPPAFASEKLSRMNYFAMTYYKAAMSIRMVESYLGVDEFDRIMQQLYVRKAFCHVSGHDFKSAFNSNGKNLDWFFDDLIGSSAKTDLSIVKSDVINGNTRVLIRNRGDFCVPYTLAATDADGSISLFQRDPFDRRDTLFLEGTDYSMFRIDPKGLIPELERNNNTFYPQTNRWLQRLPKMKFLVGPSLNEYRNISWTPIAGWNYYDRFMPGLAFYSQILPAKNADWMVMPFYSFGRNTIAGTFDYRYTFFIGSSWLHSLRASVLAKTYGTAIPGEKTTYRTIKPALTFMIKPFLTGLQNETRVTLQSTWVQNPVLVFENGQGRQVNQEIWAHQLIFSHDHVLAINTFSLNIALFQATDVLRSTVDLDWHFPLSARGKGLYLRIFGGAFILKPQGTYPHDFRLSLQGTTGFRDVLYENYYFANAERAGTFGGNQQQNTMGGFKYPTPVGLTWDWLTAINFAVDVPRIPFRLFLDAATYADAGSVVINTNQFPWVAGIQFVLPGKTGTINFPILVSDDLKRIASLNGLDKYAQKITWSVELQRINLLERRRNIHRAF